MQILINTFTVFGLLGILYVETIAMEKIAEKFTKRKGR